MEGINLNSKKHMRASSIAKRMSNVLDGQESCKEATIMVSLSKGLHSSSECLQNRVSRLQQLEYLL